MAWTLRDIPDQSGRFAVVTGATGGIGLETALRLASAGADVLLTGRDEARGAAALTRVAAARPKGSARFAIADMASLASVRAFAERVVQEGRPIDLLVNNAGVMALPQRRVTADGFEMQCATNHLGHFALTALLMPAIMRAPAPRVVAVASLAHRRGRIHFDDPQLARGYKPFDAYTQSKLANLLFSQELARRAAGSKLTSVAAHPGWATTGIMNALGSVQERIALTVAGLVGQSAAAGALPILFAATSPDVVNGGYYGPDGFMEVRGAPSVARIAPHARDRTVAARLWALSEELNRTPFPPPAALDTHEAPSPSPPG